MPNIPVTHNRPLTRTRPIRRGSRVTPTENPDEKTEGRRGRDRRRRGDRRKQQLKVRFERRSLKTRRNQPVTKTSTSDEEGHIGKNINTSA